MKTTHGLTIAAVIIVSCMLLLATYAHAQWMQDPTTGTVPQRLPDRTILAGQTALAPLLAADLIDKEKNARQRKAVVEVHVDSVELIDAAQTNHAPSLVQGHLQYRLDGGDIVTTTAKTWTFDNLSRGEHRIKVTLASNDNHPRAEPTTLKVHVP